MHRARVTGSFQEIGGGMSHRLDGRDLDVVRLLPAENEWPRRPGARLIADRASSRKSGAFANDELVAVAVEALGRGLLLFHGESRFATGLVSQLLAPVVRQERHHDREQANVAQLLFDAPGR